MAGPLIAVTDSVFPSLDPAKAALSKLNPTYRMAKSANAEDILAVAKDADAVLVTYAKLTREILTQFTRCKAIGRFGLGVDNIDLVAAKEKGIAVNYVPDYCIREVSDHAMALLLALIRKIPLSNRLVQGGRWEMPAVVPIRRALSSSYRTGALRGRSNGRSRSCRPVRGVSRETSCTTSCMRGLAVRGG